MSVIGVTPFKRHALYAWVPDSRHVSLSRCDGVYLLTYLRTAHSLMQLQTLTRRAPGPAACARALWRRPTA